MTKLKVLSLVGTRPEAIKMAPVIKALAADDRFQSIVCATGQHQEMLYQILDWFHIQPDHALNVMTANQPLAYLSGRILNGLQTVISFDKPDIVVVQGDTTTAFIGALAAFYNRVPVAHVEAGLRTFNLASPYPEEGNRQLIGRIAKWHFAPTDTAAAALAKEGITDGVYVTGNTVIDALLETTAMLKAAPRQPLAFVPEGTRVVLVTGHRRENYGEGFRQICLALKDLAQRYPDTAIVYPVHLNPNVKTVVHAELGDVKNIHLIRPLDYPDFVAAMQRAHLVITDSGGVQEEAPSLGKPVLVMRDTTERPEAVTAGTVRLVGAQRDSIVRSAIELLDTPAAYAAMARAVNPYGDGLATGRILNLLAGESAAGNTFRPRVAA
jgi:UDP-N-acetylglucosamine 2-epimerase (non-hydrolysing)